MYRASASIHTHFAHHVRGHDGPCISLHGHTWKLEVVMQARELDKSGFVVDFDRLHERVLLPCFALLDHSLAIGEQTWSETRDKLAPLGETLVASRRELLGDLGCRQPGLSEPLEGARNEWPGGIKIAVFPFTPTSERLAEWLYRVASGTFADGRASVAFARVWETLHPAETFAEYAAD